MNQSETAVDRAALAAWCEENLSSHASANAAVLLDLEVFGFTLVWGEDRYGQTVTFKLGDEESWSVRLMTWDDELNDLLGGRFGTIVLKPDAEQEVEWFYSKSRKKVTNFDENGYPKVKSPVFAVVKADAPPHGWYGSWIMDNEEHRLKRTVDSLHVVGALARLVNGEDEGARSRGRGFAFQGSLQSIRGSEIEEDESP